MKKTLLIGCLFALLVFAVAPAKAAIIQTTSLVSASASSTQMMNTGVSINTGDLLEIWAANDDVWSMGALNWRTTNADGIYSIGPYGAYEYGSLIGVVANDMGDTSGYFKAGTDFSWTSTMSGTLYLFCWDSGYSDNSGAIFANISVSPTPIPGAVWLLGSGLLGLVGLRRKMSA